MSDEYAGYEMWKGWGKLFTFSSDEASYFRGETLDCTLAGGEVLEVGFGSGSFIAWARSEGAHVVGTEVNLVLVSAAQEFGVEILPADLHTVCDAHQGRFDTIAAFDVLEHFTITEIVQFLRTVRTMLKPGGHLLLRFPNAQSPFGLAPQHGDPTHKSALSRSVLERLTQTLDLDVVRYGGAFRVTGGRPLKKIVRRLRYMLRDTIAALTNAIYAFNVPLDPVVVLVMRRRQATPEGPPPRWSNE